MFLSFPLDIDRENLLPGDVVKRVAKQQYGTGYETTYILIRSATPVVVDEEAQMVYEYSSLLTSGGYSTTFQFTPWSIKPHSDAMFADLVSTTFEEARHALLEALFDATAASRAAHQSHRNAEDRLGQLEDLIQRVTI